MSKDADKAKKIKKLKSMSVKAANDPRHKK